MDIEQLKSVRPLVVEDEPNMLTSLVSALGLTFDILYTARNGEEGLYRFYKETPDVVITDLEMPFMGGFRMLERIRAENPNVPIIITSAYSADEHYEKAKHLGVDAYLPKPYDIDALIETVYDLCCLSSGKIDLDQFSV